MEYIQRVIPAIGGFAARAAEVEGADPLIRWGSPQGNLIFIRAPSQMSSEERTSACEALVTLLHTRGGRDSAAPAI